MNAHTRMTRYEVDNHPQLIIPDFDKQPSMFDYLMFINDSWERWTMQWRCKYLFVIKLHKFGIIQSCVGFFEKFCQLILDRFILFSQIAASTIFTWPTVVLPSRWKRLMCHLSCRGCLSTQTTCCRITWNLVEFRVLSNQKVGSFIHLWLDLLR